MMGGLLVTSIASGQLISRFGRYRIFPIVGTAVMTVGMVLLTRLNVHSSTLQASLYMLVLGLGLGMVMQVLVIAVQNAVDYRNIGVATSGSILFRQVGGTFGIAIFGAIFINRLHVNLAKALPAGAAAAEVADARNRQQAAAGDPREVRQRVLCVASSGVRRRRRDRRVGVRARVVPAGGAAAQDDAAASPRSRPAAEVIEAADGELDLLDWKRRVFELYAEVRAADDPERAWQRWRAVRDELFRDHPQSPSPGYTGLDYFPYDPALRVLAEVEPIEEELREIAGSAGSLTTFRRFGRVSLPWARSTSTGSRPTAAASSCPSPTRRAGRDIRRRPLPARHREGLRPRRRRTGGSCSTSTSPTTRPAPTTPAGRARSRLPPTGSGRPIRAGERTPAPPARFAPNLSFAATVRSTDGTSRPVRFQLLVPPSAVSSSVISTRIP